MAEPLAQGGEDVLPTVDSAGAGGWPCPVGAPMANKRPPGGEGLSHSPASGG